MSIAHPIGRLATQSFKGVHGDGACPWYCPGYLCRFVDVYLGVWERWSMGVPEFQPAHEPGTRDWVISAMDWLLVHPSEAPPWWDNGWDGYAVDDEACIGGDKWLDAVEGLYGPELLAEMDAVERCGRPPPPPRAPPPPPRGVKRARELSPEAARYARDREWAADAI